MQSVSLLPSLSGTILIRVSGELWLRLPVGNENSTDQSSHSTNESLLADSILAFMTSAGEGSNEDPLRTFFRTKVASLGAVVEQVSRSAKAFASDPTQSSDLRSIVLQEANHVVIVSTRYQHLLSQASLS